ncbi:hypothetical protein NQZ68_024556 [Dissostichus eleginoides]|nr:hypothetical protein NQZ68_024556 [Dissostichus eleginoides]
MLQILYAKLKKVQRVAKNRFELLETCGLSVRCYPLRVSLQTVRERLEPRADTPTKIQLKSPPPPTTFTNLYPDSLSADTETFSGKCWWERRWRKSHPNMMLMLDQRLNEKGRISLFCQPNEMVEVL